MKHAVSAIICTRDRAARLDRTLATLAALDLADVPGFELILVDNGSGDDTPAVIRRFAAVAPFPVQVVVHTQGGVCAGRNAGIARARHPVLLFTDDDCYPAHDWVQAASRLFAEELMQIVAGRVALFDPTHLPLAMKDDPAPGRLDAVSGLVGFAHGANLAVGRPVVGLVGPFDVRLGPGTAAHAGEDVDLCYRAFRAGVPVRYHPALAVRHDHRRTGQAVWYEQVKGYAEGAGAMTMKHLLAGRTDLLRMTYWDIRSALRRWRAGGETWRWPAAKLAAIAGAVRFLFFASWRRPI